MSNYEALLQEARQALKNGNSRQARTLLHQALQQKQDDPRAWLWLAGVAASPRASLNYIEQAQQLKPGDPTIARARTWAQKRLAKAEAESAGPTPAPGAPEREKPSYLRPLAVGAVLFLALVAAALLLQQALDAGMWSDVAGGTLPGAAEARSPVDADDGPGEAQEASGPQGERQEAATGAQLARGRFLPRNPVALAAAAGPAAAAPATRPALEAKRVADGEADDAPRATWTPTPTATPTPSPTPTPVPTFVSQDTASRPAQRPPGVGPNERWVDVNLTTQRMVAYEGDTPVYESAVSSGTASHPTVTGQFQVWLRYESQTMDGRRLGYDYYLPNVPYVMYFYRDYALHGTYWHNNFGTPMSHGCVNLPTPAAEWLFHWSSYGTVVNVHY